MQELYDVLEEEFLEAVEVKRKDSARHFLTLLMSAVSLKKDALNDKREIMDGVNEVKSDVIILAKTMQEGFRQIDKRFEAVDKRFEQVDKRFEAMDKRFEEMLHYMDKRFEDQQRYMDRRFDVVNKRFTMMMWFIGILMTVSVAVIKLL